MFALGFGACPLLKTSQDLKQASKVREVNVSVLGEAHPLQEMNVGFSSWLDSGVWVTVAVVFIYEKRRRE